MAFGLSHRVGGPSSRTLRRPLTFPSPPGSPGRERPHSCSVLKDPVVSVPLPPGSCRGRRHALGCGHGQGVREVEHGNEQAVALRLGRGRGHDPHVHRPLPHLVPRRDRAAAPSGAARRSQRRRRRHLRVLSQRLALLLRRPGLVAHRRRDGRRDPQGAARHLDSGCSCPRASRSWPSARSPSCWCCIACIAMPAPSEAFGRGAGIFVALLATFVVAAGGFLKNAEPR